MNLQCEYNMNESPCQHEIMECLLINKSDVEKIVRSANEALLWGDMKCYNIIWECLKTLGIGRRECDEAYHT